MLLPILPSDMENLQQSRSLRIFSIKSQKEELRSILRFSKKNDSFLAENDIVVSVLEMELVFKRRWIFLFLDMQMLGHLLQLQRKMIMAHSQFQKILFLVMGKIILFSEFQERVWINMKSTGQGILPTRRRCS